MKWINVDGTIFNLEHVTDFKVSTFTGNIFHLEAFFIGGVAFWEREEMKIRPSRILKNNITESEGYQLIEDILTGKYSWKPEKVSPSTDTTDDDQKHTIPF